MACTKFARRVRCPEFFCICANEEFFKASVQSELNVITNIQQYCGQQFSVSKAGNIEDCRRRIEQVLVEEGRPRLLLLLIMQYWKSLNWLLTYAHLVITSGNISVSQNLRFAIFEQKISYCFERCITVIQTNLEVIHQNKLAITGVEESYFYYRLN